MKKIIATVSVISLSFLLSACKAEHDIDWYKSHDSERLSKVAECKKQAEDNQDADCKNAMEAQRYIQAFGKPGDYSTPPMTKKG